MPFKCNYCCLQFRLKGTTTRKHNLNLICMKACRNFASKVTEGNTCFAKKFTEVQYTKKAFKFLHVHINVHVCVYDQYCTWMARVELWMLSLPKAKLTPINLPLPP